MTGPKRWVYDLQLDPRPQSGDRTAARKTHSQPEVQSTFGMGARYMSSGYLSSKSHVCFFVCVCLKKEKKSHITHWQVPKDFRPLLTSLFLSMRNLVQFCLLLRLLLTFNPLRARCPARLSSGLTRQARQEAVGLVAFSTMTSLPPGMT